jgi:hypothetical protein
MQTRVIAVDWSGRAKGGTEAIWLAEVAEGKLVELRCGATPHELISELCLRALRERLIVGLDFAFSFPRWWCEEQSWNTPREVWEGVARSGETWLRACGHPFWGRSGRQNPHPVEKLFRRTDREDAAGAAKSVFQIGGAGAVGTASIRGMPHLLTLADAGFSIWPFADASRRTVLEIYPRALTAGSVRKSSWRCRHNYVFKHLADQPDTLLERAAGSEDAFDAAVSALAMNAHVDQLVRLVQLGEPYRIEGRIWTPPAD